MIPKAKSVLKVAGSKVQNLKIDRFNEPLEPVLTCSPKDIEDSAKILLFRGAAGALT